MKDITLMIENTVTFTLIDIDYPNEMRIEATAPVDVDIDEAALSIDDSDIVKAVKEQAGLDISLGSWSEVFVYQGQGGHGEYTTQSASVCISK